MRDLSTFGLRTHLKNTILLDGDRKPSVAEQWLVLKSLESQVLPCSGINVSLHFSYSLSLGSSRK